MATILDRIIESKLREVERARRARSSAELERQIPGKVSARDFTSSLLRRGEVRIIAEVKKASPSAGVIRPDFDPESIARTYDSHGAAAVSVLTDAEFFQGSLSDLSAVRSAVACPVLRKDFVLDDYQLLESRAAGADAVLLIAECLPGDRLAKLQRRASELGLHTLVELHDAGELSRVLDTPAPVIGINNRDLRTFGTRIEHTLELLPLIPADRVVVSESGISTHADVVLLGRAGVKAVLVGESLIRSPDVGAALDALRGVR